MKNDLSKKSTLENRDKKNSIIYKIFKWIKIITWTIITIYAVYISFKRNGISRRLILAFLFSPIYVIYVILTNIIIKKIK